MFLQPMKAFKMDLKHNEQSYDFLRYPSDSYPTRAERVSMGNVPAGKCAEILLQIPTRSMRITNLYLFCVLVTFPSRGKFMHGGL